MTQSMGPGKALVSSAQPGSRAKFWGFTLGAVAVIGDAGHSRSTNIATFVPFVFLAELSFLAIVTAAVTAPTRSDGVLAAISD